MSGAGAERPAGLTALDAELRRGMAALTAKGQPPPYFVEDEAYDQNEVGDSASQGALVQSSARRSRTLDTDVRVGDYALDSTHILRSSDFDFSSVLGGHPVAVPLDDGRTARARCARSPGPRSIAAMKTRPSAT